MSAPDYDIIIIGGGMIGASLALSLAHQPLRIAIVEAVPFCAETQPSYDDRAIALSFGSQRIFEGLGLWPTLAKHATPIEHIHISDQGHFGFARLDCREERVTALGYVITARDIGATLVGGESGLGQSENLTLISPARVTDLKLGSEHATVIIERSGNTETLRARLVVAADGGDSSVRRQLDIRTTQRDYQQTAITANITPAQPHRNVAFERFTHHGPLALLPMEENCCALVWTRAPQDAERLLALDDETFLAELQACFGQRLGRLLKVGQRATYPLRLIRAQEQVRARLALIGNAAHTLHPIAGQGFNLGLRDIATLAQTIVDAQRHGKDIGTLPVLEPYAHWRNRDHRQVIGFTNALVQGFSNRFPPLALARNLGLLATDLCPPLKHTLARHAMGIAGKLPRLARGLPL